MNEIAQLQRTPNTMYGIPGRFWYANGEMKDEYASVLASVHRYNEGSFGPAGWYIDQGMIFMGTEEPARDYVVRVASAHALKLLGVGAKVTL